MGSITRTKQVGLSRGQDWTRFDYDTVSLPSGCTWTRWKVEATSGDTSDALIRDMANIHDIAWNTWYYDMTWLLYLSATPRLFFKNRSSSQFVDVASKITLEYQDAYTAVTKGNKIMATDRSQTGTTTTVGAVMSDSHFSAGTIATASDFNTKVLGK